MLINKINHSVNLFSCNIIKENKLSIDVVCQSNDGFNYDIRVAGTSHD
jgi:hypothetical protein